MSVADDEPLEPSAQNQTQQTTAPEAEGQALMRHAERSVPDRGYPEIWLDVFASSARATTV